MMTQPLNDRLREERKRKGLTQEQLAGLMSVSRQTISHWETGRASPDYESLRHLSEALEINLSDLLGEEKEQQAADVAIPSAAQEEEPALQPQQRAIPRFVCWIGAAALALCILAGAWLYFQKPDEPLITPDFFSESSPRMEGMAWLDIVVYQLPVPRSPSKNSSLYQWYYPIYFREENGVDITIDLCEEWGFFADGNISYYAVSGEGIPWGKNSSSTIYGGRSRKFSKGDTSLSPINGLGIQLTCTDEFGNKLFFRKYIPYSLEIQP